jgi:hypothetical protein
VSKAGHVRLSAWRIGQPWGSHLTSTAGLLATAVNAAAVSVMQRLQHRRCRYNIHMDDVLPPGTMSIQRVAEIAGLTVRSVSSYLARGDMPEPDYRVGNSPLWKNDTIEGWLESRPGKGWRGMPSFSRFMSGKTPMVEIYRQRVKLYDASSRDAGGPMKELTGSVVIGSRVLAVAPSQEFVMGVVTRADDDRITVRDPGFGTRR